MYTCKTTKVAAVLCFLALAVISAPAFGQVTDKWVAVDKFNAVVANERGGNDSFVMQGKFNLPVQAVIESTDFTLSIDSTWSCTIPAASWRRNGKSHSFTAKSGDVTASVTYWVNNSSKCTFKVNARHQSLMRDFPDPEGFVVTLAVGTQFEESTAFEIGVRGKTAHMTGVGPGDIFVIDKLQMKRNPRGGRHDSMVFEARMCTEGDLDAEATNVQADFGPFHMEFPLQDMTVSGIYHKYKGTLATGEKVSVTVNDNTGKMVVVASGLDLSALTSDGDVPVSFSFSGTSVAWSLVVHATVNKAHSVYKY